MRSVYTGMRGGAATLAVWSQTSTSDVPHIELRFFVIVIVVVNQKLTANSRGLGAFYPC